MKKMLTTVFLIALVHLAFVFGQGDDGGSCPRDNEKALQRNCMKKCTTDQECRGKRKKCVCDGVCGRSCVNPGVRCKPLDEIENGRIEVLPFNRLGAKAKYVCDEGYMMMGSGERQCQGDGLWSGEAPTCEGDYYCGPPPEIPNAKHNGGRHQRYLIGTQLQYTCNMGYYRDGFYKAMCIGERKWVGPRMSCSPRSCGHPGDIDNGRRIGNIFIFPKRVTYFCDIGYKIIGKQYRICQANGKWTGATPRCIAIECPHLPPPEHGTVKGSLFVYNSVLDFTCDRGYQLRGVKGKQLTRRCTAEAEWDGTEALCELVDCGEPKPLYNGKIEGESNKYGAQKVFKCNKDTLFHGASKMVTCLESGKWSDETPNCFSPCKIPMITNGFVDLDDNEAQDIMVEHSTMISFRCIHGHQLNVTAGTKSMCSNGTWTLIPHCTPAPCNDRPPVIRNGIVRYHKILHGNKSKYRCMTGFRLKGNSVLTCSYGEWVGDKPYCEPVYCPYPGTIKHGKILLKGVIGKYEYRDYVKRIGQGQEIEFQCEAGYRQVGPTGATCVDGVWSPDIKPECVEEKHPVLEKPWTRRDRAKRAYVSKSTRGDLVWLEDENVDYDDDDEAIALDCTVPSGLEHLLLNTIEHKVKLLSGSLVPSGFSVKMECKKGYKVKGRKGSKIKCSGGEWSHDFMKCAPMHCPFKGTLDHGTIYLKAAGANVKYRSFMRNLVQGQGLVYECMNGYHLVGPENTTCDDGKWSPSVKPMCVRNEHPDIESRGKRSKRSILSTIVDAENDVNRGQYKYLNCKVPHNIEYMTMKTVQESVPLVADSIVPSGFSVHVQCTYGYEPNDPVVDVKCSGGQWMKKFPKCVPSSCQVPLLLNGMYRNQQEDVIRKYEFPHLGTLDYVCDENYTNTSETHVKCMYGKWTPEEPGCKKVFRHCTLPNIDNAQLRFDTSYMDLAPGTEVLVSCHAGYVLEGQNKIQCSENGTWTETIPKCKPFCRNGHIEFHKKDNRILRGNNMKVIKGVMEEDCLALCRSEYTFYCLSVDYYPAERKCQLSKENQQSKPADFIYMDDAVHYEKICLPVTCPKPVELTNGNILITNPNFTVGSVIFFSCNLGYHLDSKSPTQAECQPDALWSANTPTCISDNAPASPSKKTHRDDNPCQRLPANTKVIMSYKGVRLDYLLKGIIPHRGVIVSRCDDVGEYIMDGSQMLVCNNGTWIGKNPECKRINKYQVHSVPRMKLTVTKNDYTILEDGRVMIRPGNKVTIDCHLFVQHLMAPRWRWNSGTNERHLPGGKRLHVGKVNEENSGIYTCVNPLNGLTNSIQIDVVAQETESHCSPPPAPARGYKVPNTIDNFETGSAVFYYCSPGYKLIGNTTVYCYNDGTWSGVPPECEAVKCPKLAIHEPELTMTYSGNTAGERVTFMCRDGYHLHGQQEATCKHVSKDNRAYWDLSHGTPHCRAVTCPDLDVSDDLNVVTRGKRYTEEMQFECKDASKYLTGVDKITCQADGMWSDSVPSCVEVCQDPGTPAHGYRVPDLAAIGDVFAKGTHMTFGCEENYALEGLEEITCTGRQLQWTGISPECKHIHDVSKR
ncbi:sushi, von Willebrand factor type A, EGF and pentraxin domain-containing protein 1-like isoform X2 [Lineus longissimus]|uniref:sushi, von Willebrand factor type A, EGF and pentraxin domain-containing protein 1-like isoform X2 n=1 Tax=Lineus longissimus TaxID=88925 RepID=UPI002B4C516F